MKKIIIIVLFLCGNYAFSQSGWFVQKSGSDSYLWDIEMFDEFTAVMAASEGTVFRTSNGGTNWIQNQLFTGGDLFALEFPVNSTGYAAGSGGRIYKSTNSGINWFQIFSPTGNSILAMEFINVSTGFIGGGTSNDGEIFKTTNGGLNWTEYGPGVLYPQVISIHFPSVNIGYAAGDHSLIMKSSNGGLNWSQQNSGLNNVTFFSVFFINDNTGFATNPIPGSIIKTTNGGANWNINYQNNDHFLVIVNFPAPDTGFAAGGAIGQNVVLKTINGGNNWQPTYLNFTGHLNSFDFINSKTGYMTGDEGRLYKTTDGGTVGINSNSEIITGGYELFQNFPNPFNPETKIKFSIPEYSKVNLKVFDINGKLIAVLVSNKFYNYGTYEVNFDAGKYRIASGIYFYKLETENTNITKKLVLIK